VGSVIEPPRWTREELEAARAAAIARFREVRMREPAQRYREAFAARRADVERLLGVLGQLAAPPDQTAVQAALTDEALQDVVRYLLGPPVSADDLEVLTEASLAPGALRKDAAARGAVWTAVLGGLDRARFPWAFERAPGDGERAAAVLATAALMATQRVATDRRNESKNQQEEAVFTALAGIGFARVPARVIETLDAAPLPGQCCPESMLGGRKADVVVRLHDRRILAIECKVSNSETNSVKRLKNDVAAKAEKWLSEFGTRQLIPVAMLSGCFSLISLDSAQERGVTVFWEHDLGAFCSWVESAR